MCHHITGCWLFSYNSKNPPELLNILHIHNLESGTWTRNNPEKYSWLNNKSVRMRKTGSSRVPWLVKGSTAWILYATFSKRKPLCSRLPNEILRVSTEGHTEESTTVHDGRVKSKLTTTKHPELFKILHRQNIELCTIQSQFSLQFGAPQRELRYTMSLSASSRVIGLFWQSFVHRPLN